MSCQIAQPAGRRTRVAQAGRWLHTDRERLRGTRPLRVAGLLALLIALPALSGCISLDGLFTDRPAPKVLVEPGQVRVWFAVKPGPLPPEFRHLNITVGHMLHLVDSQASEFEVIANDVTVDLIKLETTASATLVGGLPARQGDFSGLLFSITEAELVRDKVVGNQDGQAKTRTEHVPVVAPANPATLSFPHGVLDGSITDLYVELDLQRSLLTNGVNSFEWVHGVHGVSIYLDGAKVDHVDYTGRAAFAAQRALYGDVTYGPDPTVQNPNGPSRPKTFIWLGDDQGERLYYGAEKRVYRAIGRGEELTLKVIFSNGDGRVESGRGYPLEEVVWDFGDGTRARGVTLNKTYETGGVFDIILLTRDPWGRLNSDFITIFVPYGPDEATEVHTETRAGSIIASPVAAKNQVTLRSERHVLHFAEDVSEGTFNLGGYRVTLDYQAAVAHEEDQFLGLSEMMLNVTSGTTWSVQSGPSPVRFEGAGIPVHQFIFTDWVEERIDIHVELLQGTAVDYELTVEALYFANFSRGLDHHGRHDHDAWHWTQPYWSGLTPEGRRAPPEADEA